MVSSQRSFIVFTVLYSRMVNESFLCQWIFRLFSIKASFVNQLRASQRRKRNVFHSPIKVDRGGKRRTILVLIHFSALLGPNSQFLSKQLMDSARSDAHPCMPGSDQRSGITNPHYHLARTVGSNSMGRRSGNVLKEGLQSWMGNYQYLQLFIFKRYHRSLTDLSQSLSGSIQKSLSQNFYVNKPLLSPYHCFSCIMSTIMLHQS